MSQVSIIDIEGNHPQIPTRFDANVGFAIPLANVLEIYGNITTAGSNPVHTVGSGNNITTYVQLSQAIAATDSTKVGLSAFNSSHFSVDANGFVSLVGGGAGVDSFAMQTGLTPVTPNGVGLVTFNGSVVAAGTNPVRTDGTGANTMAVEVQISQAIAATDATKIGLSNFNSAHFSVDANGFVSLTGGGQAIDSFTTDVSGPVAPNGAGNVAFTGATNIFSDGSVANTMRLNLQGTNHALYVGRGSNTASANLAVGTNGQVLIAATGADPAFATLTSSDGSITFTPGANSLSLQVASGTTVGKTITGNTGGALSPTAGNWNIPGNNTALNGFAAYTTGSGSTLTVNSFGRNIWVVHPTSGVGTHTTIQAAVTAASAGDTVVVTAKSTAYTENVTLKAGVNIVGDTADAFTPNVTVSGTLTHNTAGTVSLSGIRLQTNSAACLAVTGSAASIVNLINCYTNCTNNTGITFSSSSSSAQINMYFCAGDLGTTGIGLFSNSSSGAMSISSSLFGNSGGSSTASTASAGVLNIVKSNFVFPITTSGTNAFQMEYGSFDSSGQNATSLTLGGSGSQFVRYTKAASGSASSISIGSTAVITACEVNSSNTNAITGAGTITYSGIIFAGSSTTINTTTQTSCGTLQGSKNTAPAAGFLGERISSAAVSVAAGATTVATTLTSITLTAGVWDISAVATGITGSFNFTFGQIGISTTTNTFQGNYGDQNVASNAAVGATVGYISGTIPVFRAVINTSTTYYLVTSFTYASGSPTVSGRITGIRVG